MTARLVTAYRLAHVLHLPVRTVRALSLPGKTYVGGQAHFSIPEIDAFLQDPTVALNFCQPPTLARLLSGDIVMLRPDEARALIAAPNSRLLRLVQDGELSALKLTPNLMRYNKSSLEALGIPPGYITIADARHILGYSRDTMELLPDRWHFVFEPSIVNKHLQLMPQKALCAILADMLPGWIDSDDWIKERRGTPLPLVQTSAAAKRLGLTRPKLLALLQKGVIRHIQTPGGQRLISPASLLYYEESQQPLEDVYIQAVFGVGQRASLHAWRRKGLLTCRLHNHENDILWHNCLVAIVEPLLNHSGAIEWCHNRTLRPALTLAAAAQFSGFSKAELDHMATTGELKGIRSPAGVWAFAHTQLREARQARFRAAQ